MKFIIFYNGNCYLVTIYAWLENYATSKKKYPRPYEVYGNNNKSKKKNEMNHKKFFRSLWIIWL